MVRRAALTATLSVAALTMAAAGAQADSGTFQDKGPGGMALSCTYVPANGLGGGDYDLGHLSTQASLVDVAGYGLDSNYRVTSMGEFGDIPGRTTGFDFNVGVVPNYAAFAEVTYSLGGGSSQFTVITPCPAA